MRKLILAAGAAALAITVPVAADPGKNESGKRGAQKFERAKKANSQRAEQVKKAREQRREFAQKANEKRSERAKKAREQRFETAKKGQERSFERAKKQNEQVFEARKRAVEQQRKLADRRRDDDRDVIRLRDRDDDGRRWARVFGTRGARTFANGCPPGLVPIGAGCMPYGHAKRIQGVALPTAFKSNVLPLRLRNIYRDDDRFTYRYGNGYLYRVDRDKQLVSAILPLIGAGLGIGTPFPTTYNTPNYFVPTTYRPFFRDRNDDYFRYANGYVYEIDRDTGLIENMTPLLDRGYGMGQMLPASYGAYNVPYQYRPMYYDTPNMHYRYAPGAIYQVDPTTQLITAVASLLAPGLAVGQPLPSAYSAYNVPLGYRDMYYDTPDAWYRYNNGNIYQIDPTTQLVTALIRAIV